MVKTMVTYLQHGQMQSPPTYTMSDGNNTTQLEAITVETDLSVWISKDLKPTEQCIQAAKKAQSVLGVMYVLQAHRPTFHHPIISLAMA